MGDFNNRQDKQCIALTPDGRYLVLSESQTFGGSRARIETTTNINEAHTMLPHYWKKALESANYAEPVKLIHAIAIETEKLNNGANHG